MADGGPSEQGAIPILTAEVLKNVNMVSRDRAHRAQSVMKGVYAGLNDLCEQFLAAFTTGEKSLARMLKTRGFEVEREIFLLWDARQPRVRTHKPLEDICLLTGTAANMSTSSRMPRVRVRIRWPK